MAEFKLGEKVVIYNNGHRYVGQVIQTGLPNQCVVKFKHEGALVDQETVVHVKQLRRVAAIRRKK